MRHTGVTRSITCTNALALSIAAGFRHETQQDMKLPAEASVEA